MSGAELKPCPFCGGEASANGTIQYTKMHQAWWPDGSQILKAHYVNCMRCGADNKRMHGHQTQADAIAAWNTRPATTPDPAAIARAALLHLREIVREYPAENHGSLPDDPHACAKQVRDEILATLDRIDPAALDAKP